MISPTATDLGEIGLPALVRELTSRQRDAVIDSWNWPQRLCLCGVPCTSAQTFVGAGEPNVRRGAPAPWRSQSLTCTPLSDRFGISTPNSLAPWFYREGSSFQENFGQFPIIPAG